MGALSSHKGSRYERRVACAVSGWMTCGITDDAIWRSSQSGGRTTLKNRKVRRTHHASTQAGDFDGNSPEGIEFLRAFYCDSKFLKDLKTWGWIYQQQGACPGTIDRVWGEADEYGRIPMGLFKENSRNDLMLTNALGHAVFCKAYQRESPNQGGMPYLCQFFRRVTPLEPTPVEPELEPIYVYRWANFAVDISWQAIREVLIEDELLIPVADTLLQRPITA